MFTVLKQMLIVKKLSLKYSYKKSAYNFFYFVSQHNFNSIVAVVVILGVILGPNISVYGMRHLHEDRFSGIYWGISCFGLILLVLSSIIFAIYHKNTTYIYSQASPNALYNRLQDNHKFKNDLIVLKEENNLKFYSISQQWIRVVLFKKPVKRKEPNIL